MNIFSRKSDIKPLTSAPPSPDQSPLKHDSTIAAIRREVYNPEVIPDLNRILFILATANNQGLPLSELYVKGLFSELHSIASKSYDLAAPELKRIYEDLNRFPRKSSAIQQDVVRQRQLIMDKIGVTVAPKPSEQEDLIAPSAQSHRENYYYPVTNDIVYLRRSNGVEQSCIVKRVVIKDDNKYRPTFLCDIYYHQHNSEGSFQTTIDAVDSRRLKYTGRLDSRRKEEHHFGSLSLPELALKELQYTKAGNVQGAKTVRRALTVLAISTLDRQEKGDYTIPPDQWQIIKRYLGSDVEKAKNK